MADTEKPADAPAEPEHLNRAERRAAAHGKPVPPPHSPFGHQSGGTGFHPGGARNAEPGKRGALRRKTGD